VFSKRKHAHKLQNNNKIKHDSNNSLLFSVVLLIDGVPDEMAAMGDDDDEYDSMDEYQEPGM